MLTATLHVLRLGEPITARQVIRPTVPDGARLWIVGPEASFPGDGRIESEPTRIIVIGTWEDPSVRDRFLARDPAGVLAPRVVEGWHAVAAAYRTHGEVNWSGAGFVDQSGPAPAPNAGEPVLTITTTGFSEEADKADALVDAMGQVQSAATVVDGRLRTVVSLGRRRDDGRTVTLWRDEPSLLSWAYRSEPHRTMIARQRDEEIMPRSSFTRFRIERAWGTWDGVDPLS